MGLSYKPKVVYNTLTIIFCLKECTHALALATREVMSSFDRKPSLSIKVCTSYKTFKNIHFHSKNITGSPSERNIKNSKFW